MRSFRKKSYFGKFHILSFALSIISRNCRIFYFHENFASFLLPFSKFVFAKQFANTTENFVEFRIFLRKFSFAGNPSNVYSFHLLDILWVYLEKSQNSCSHKIIRSSISVKQTEHIYSQIHQTREKQCNRYTWVWVTPD